MGFLTTIYFGLDGQVVAKGTTNYNTIDEAEIQYHIALASAMGKEEYSKAIALVFNENGFIVFSRIWERQEA